MAELSVIIPVYKVERYLRQCLDSVVFQTFSDLEIILIDDGSPDGCGEICDEYAAGDGRIRVIHKDNAGLCNARNDGLDTASGRYVAFVDSDDWLETDIYEKMMQAIRAEDADIVMCNYYRDTGDSSAEIRFLARDGVTEDPDEIRRMQMSVLAPRLFGTKKHGACFCWNRIFKRSFLMEHHLYFENVKVQEDLIHSFSTLQFARRVAYITDAGYHYRFVETSNMAGYKPDREELDREALGTLYRLAWDYRVSPDVYEALCVFAVESLRPMLLCGLFNSENPMPRREKIRSLKEILSSAPYSTALKSIGMRQLEAACRPCAVLKTHSALYLYIANRLQMIKRRAVGIRKD